MSDIYHRNPFTRDGRYVGDPVFKGSIDGMSRHTENTFGSREHRSLVELLYLTEMPGTPSNPNNEVALPGMQMRALILACLAGFRLLDNMDAIPGSSIRDSVLDAEGARARLRKSGINPDPLPQAYADMMPKTANKMRDMMADELPVTGRPDYADADDADETATEFRLRAALRSIANIIHALEKS